MIARFLLGAGLGGLVGTGILVITSILVPMAERPAPAGHPAVPEVAPVAPLEVSPQETASADLPEVSAPEVTAQAPDAPAGTAPEGTAPDTPHAEPPAPDAAADPSGSAPAVMSGVDAAPALTDTPVEPPETRVEAVAPAAPAQPVVPESSAGVSPASEPSLAPDAGLAAGPDSPAVPAADLPPGADIADAGLPPLSPEEEAMLAEIEENGLEAIPEELRPALVPGAETSPEAAPAESTEAQPDAAPTAVTEALPEPAVEEVAPVEPARRIVTGGGSTLEPSPGLAGRDGGNGRLPRIGDAPAPAGASEAPPLERYARPFENAGGKPVFAIVLIDDGRADLDRAALADLPFPVSFALDPMDPAAADHARIYREGGQEVVMLATALPEGAVATDVEVAFDAMDRALPEAVVVMDPPGRRFQSDRALAALVVSATGAQGRGMLTWEGGLNAAMQVALREDVPVTAAFRNLDAEDEAGAVVRRYLDRAAFKAAQVGRVTVVGRTRAETVEALLEWAVEGRAATVALAPVSAALAVD